MSEIGDWSRSADEKNHRAFKHLKIGDRFDRTFGFLQKWMEWGGVIKDDEGYPMVQIWDNYTIEEGDEFQALMGDALVAIGKDLFLHFTTENKGGKFDRKIILERIDKTPFMQKTMRSCCGFVDFDGRGKLSFGVCGEASSRSYELYGTETEEED